MELKKIHIPESFYSLFAVARMMGIPKATVARFDKSSPSSVGELSPIAHLFMCFEESGRQTWAIRKSYFEKWRSTGKVPKISTGRPPKWKDNPDVVNINIPFPKSIYDEFKSIVDAGNSMTIAKVAYRDMIAVAVKEFNDRRRHILGGDKYGSRQKQ